MEKLTRRGFVGSLAAGAAALSFAGCASRPGAARPDLKDGDFTVVHLTDMHVRRKRQGHLGYQACIDSVNALPVRPALALMGGDLAFDGNYTPKEEFADQIQLYKSVSDGLACPYYNCIGNHDALGWSARRKVAADDPDVGKKFIMDRLGMEKSYYSFDHGDWHFVVLDSIFGITTDSGPTQEARLGEEQLHWLANDLGRAGDRPKVLVTHIAVFCNIGQLNGDAEAKAMAPGMVLKDNKDLRMILERHKAKAVLQGHSHQNEDYMFNGVHYITSHAVSAAWWSGNWNGFDPGYTVLTCRADGRLSWERVNFPWEPRLEPEDTLELKKTGERAAFLAEQQRLLELERAGGV